jgi:hypothetical protein
MFIANFNIVFSNKDESIFYMLEFSNNQAGGISYIPFPF